MKLAVGVITYNNNEVELKKFLRSYEISTTQLLNDVEVRLYFIENGSTSHTLCSHKGAAQIPSRGNIGFSQGMNLLMAGAFNEWGADAFLTANPDGAFHHSTLKELFVMHQKYPKALIEALQFPEEHPKIYDRETLETEWASGCAMLIPRMIYSKTKGFDEKFFLYLEDVDFSWRTRASGFQILVCPKALFSHSVIGRSDNIETKKFYYTSGRYLGWKWGNKKFARWCESALLNELGFNKDTLPKLTNEKSSFSRYSKFARFDQLFSFAETRW